MRETQPDVINSGAELRPYHIQHAVYGLNTSPLTWIQRLSSRTESELLPGRRNEESDNVPLPNTTNSSGLIR